MWRSLSTVLGCVAFAPLLFVPPVFADLSTGLVVGVGSDKDALEHARAVRTICP